MMNRLYLKLACYMDIFCDWSCAVRERGTKFFEITLELNFPGI